MKYSLANYILSVEPNDSQIKDMFGGTIAIGGEGSYLGSISLSLANPQWSTTGYATGAWIHSKNLDRHGTVTVTLSQLSDPVSRFIQVCARNYGNDYDGFTLSLSDISGKRIATCVDCYITQIPDQTFADTAGTQSWSFTCGQINYS